MNQNSSLAERSNYFRRLRSPLFLITGCIAFSESIFWALLRRITPKLIVTASMPTSIRTLQTRFLKEKECTKLKEDSYQTNDLILNDSVRLKLAIGYFTYQNASSWLHTFSDPEIEISLHRWGWLLWGLNENSASLSREQGLALVRSWLRYCEPTDSFGLDAYSTSERIVNGSIFFLKTGDGTIPPDIQSSFRRMSLQVAENLEYYEGDRTGNHAFNNARGLFFAGTLADSPDAIALAFAIFRERLPKIISHDGFLREASSHYHFLFTRWILEVYWLAVQNGQKVIAAFLAPYAGKFVEHCWFFLVKDEVNGNWSIPLIGDISPDFTPEWLLSVPWSSLATELYMPEVLPCYQGDDGWATLFGITPCVDDKSPVYQSISYPKSFWHRIVQGQSIVFVHAESLDGAARADHRHLDLGGFVLYRSGALILSDCGRIDYTQSALSEYGRGAYAHNTVFVNGLSPDVDAPSWFQKSYKSVDVTTELCKSDLSTEFTLWHNGFDRLANETIQHERKLILRSTSFEIEDRLIGSERCEIMLRFHLAPGLELLKIDSTNWSVAPIDAIFKIDDRFETSVLVGQICPIIGGVSASRYGVTEECPTLEMKGSLCLPLTITNTLNWD